MPHPLKFITRISFYKKVARIFFTNVVIATMAFGPVAPIVPTLVAHADGEPVIVITSPTEGQNVEQSLLSPAFTITGADSNCSTEIDGGGQTFVACSNTTADFGALSLGSHTITIRGANGNGSTTQNVTFTIVADTGGGDGDTTPPAIAITTPTTGSTNTWNPVVDWGDAGTCNYKFDSDSFTAVDCGSAGSDIPRPSPGEHTLYVQAFDASSNESNQNVYFVLTPNFRFLKWEITKKKGVENCAGTACVQASEFQLLDNGSPVSWPSGTEATNPGGYNPGGPTGEIPNRLIDGDTGTKWNDLYFNADSSAVTGSSVVIIDTGVGNSVSFTDYKWVTANDVTDRDPVSWQLFGGDNGTDWTLLDSRNDESITDSRNSATDIYSLGLPAAPGAPTDLGQVGITSSSVTLFWNGPASNGGSAITDYIVEYSLHDANDWHVFNDGVQAITTTAIVTGLANLTEYDFRVSAVNLVATGSISTPVSVTTRRSLGESLVGYWKLGTPDGRWFDSFGVNDLLRTTTNLNMITSGKIEGGALFRPGSYLSHDDNVNLSTGDTDFTVSAWVRLDSKNDTQVFVSKYGDAGTGEYALYYEPGSDRFMFSTYTATAAYGVQADTFGSPNVDTWYHLIGVHDKNAHTNSITVNGTFTDTISDVVEHLDSDGPFVIGAFGSGHAYSAMGAVDEVGFWKRALDSTDITELYAGGNGNNSFFTEGSPFAGGEGSPEDPYQIATCTQLQRVDAFLSSNFIITADLSCASQGNDIIIGDQRNPFSGNFNGGGHKITIAINSDSGNYIGLFSKLNNATVSDLWVNGVVSANSGNAVGGLTGYASGSTISRVVSTVTVTGIGSNYGGIAGFAQGSTVISNSYSNSSISSGTTAGGIVGFLDGSYIDHAYAVGSVHTTSDEAGGIVGYTTGGAAIQTVFSAAEISVGTTNGGGVVGNLTSGSVTYAFWNSITSGTTDCIGSVPGVIIECTPETASMYFKGNNDNAPFSGFGDTDYDWDFDTVWEIAAAGYPALRSITGDELANSPFVGGDGSIGDPYQIGACSGFVAMNEAGLDQYYLLTRDLNCTSSGNAIMIGTEGSPFTGGFNGAGYKIAVALTSTGEGDNYIGLFRSTYSGSIHNIRIGGTITVSAQHGTGSLIGRAYGTYIYQVASDATITSDYYNVGGLIGESDASVMEDSYFNGSVTSNEYAGGLIGSAESGTRITRTYSVGAVYSDMYHNPMGGLIGYAAPGSTVTVEDSFSAGTIDETSYAIIGTDVGSTSYSSTYFDAYSTGANDCSDVYTQIGGDCAAVNTDGSEPNYFKNNFVAAPFFGIGGPVWDFNTVWSTQANGYPLLRGLVYSDPITVTAPVEGSVVLSWDPVVDWGDATICEYKYNEDDYEVLDCSENGADIPQVANPYTSKTLTIRGTTDTLDVLTDTATFFYYPTTQGTKPSDGVYTWIHRTSPDTRQWTNVATSADGSHLFMGAYGEYLYTSDDYGATWDVRTAPGSQNWRYVASSATGQYLLASAENIGIYSSNDYGATWNAFPGSPSDPNIASSYGNPVVISADGKYQFFGGSGAYTYRSNNYGVTWDALSGNSELSSASLVSLSADGSHVIVYANGQLNASEDYGVTWQGLMNRPNVNFTSAQLSADGQHIIAGSWPGYVYTSNDFGVTWTEQTSLGDHFWLSTALSADGSTMAVGVNYDFSTITGPVYVSVDSGTTWTEQTALGTDAWAGFAVSANGTKLAITPSNGQIWTGSFDGSVAFVSPTPDDLSTQSSNTLEVSLSSQDFVDGHYTFTDLDHSVTGLWRFENTMDDESVNGNNADTNGDVTTTSGKFGQAGDFDEGYLSMNRPIQDNFTVCSWIKTSSIGNGTQHWTSAPILDSEVSGGTNDFGFGIDSEGHLEFGTGAGGDYTVNGSVFVSDNAWHQGCVTRNTSTGEIHIYVDGGLDTTGTGGTGVLNANSLVRVGYGFDGASYLVGKIDELITFNRVLGSDEIASLYDARVDQYDHQFTGLSAGAHTFTGYSVNTAGTKNTTEERTVTIDSSYSGAGTEGDPYQITTCSQLQEMNQQRAAYYILENDIDCSETATWNPNADEWVDGVVGGTLIPDDYSTVTHTDIVVTNNGYSGFEPVGTGESAFTGVFNGNNKTISNLWIFRKDSDENGIFGYTEDATITDLTIANSNIVGEDNTGALAGYVIGGTISGINLSNNMVRAYFAYNGGGLAGRVENGAVISDIVNTGGAVHGSGNIIGGLIGSIYDSTLDSSSSSADVDGGWEIGGVIGEGIQSTITNTFASGGTVTSNRSEYLFMKTGYNAGGFAGYLSGGSVSQSYATNTVDSSGSYAGGFAGAAYGTTIINSYATGNVSAYAETVEGNEFTPLYVGGFLGQADGAIITNTFASGTVSSPGGYVGGYAGNVGNSTILNSYAAGDVSGDNLIGGFAGAVYNSQISTSYSSGSVTGDDGSNDGGGSQGGFVGAVGASQIDHSFSTGLVSHVIGTYGGFIGFDDGENTLYSNFYDQIRSDQTGCMPEGDSEGCSPVNTETSPNAVYFKNNKINTPLNTWDFETPIWNTEVGSYPKLFGLSPTNTEVVTISSCSDFENINNDLDGSYVLSTNLDCRNEGNAIIIGDDNNPFTGTFNGNGNTIQFTINVEEGSVGVGLFATTEGASIANLVVSGSLTTSGWHTVGSIVGNASNTFLDNVHSSVALSSTGTDGNSVDIGGIAGVIDDGSVVINSSSSGSVSENYSVGGIGGLVGVVAYGSLVSKSYATGEVSFNGNIIYCGVGGLVGCLIYGSEVDQSYAQGAVNGNDGVGGLVGLSFTSTIEDSYATGAVSGNTDIGGLVGSLVPGSTILRSYTTGSVTGDGGGSDGGGLAGYATDSNIFDSFATGLVSGFISNTGGVVGIDDGGLNYDGVRYSEDQTGQLVCAPGGDNPGCYAVDTEGEPDTNYFIDNYENAPMSNWDFESVWQTLENTTPRLRGISADDTVNSPSVSTVNPSSIGNYSANLNGNIISLGATAVTARGFEYGTTDAYGQTFTEYGNYETGSFSKTIYGLTPNETYHYRTFAVNSLGTTYGEDIVFVASGSVWQDYGTPGFSQNGTSVYRSFKIAPNGDKYAAYADCTIWCAVTVKKFVDNDWQTIGTEEFNENYSDYVEIAFDSDSVPYVLFRESNNNYKLSVVRWNGSEWVYVGGAGFTTSGVDYPRLVIGGDNIPYVAYRDNGNSYKLHVMKFDGDEWVDVGDPNSLSDGTANYIGATVDSNNNLYVAFTDDANTSTLTVKKWDGTNWSTVGGIGFTNNYIYDKDITTDANGNVYVAFEDCSDNCSTSVMKFDGVGWQYLGNPQFTNADTYSQSIALNGEGVPYIAYRNCNSNCYADVMKFVDGSWISVGGTHVSSGSVGSPVIQFDSENIPYLAYGDDNLGNKITVKYLPNLTYDYYESDETNTDVSPSSPGTLITYLNAIKTTSIDGEYWITDISQSDTGHDSQVFKMPQDLTGITTPEFTVHWTGHGAAAAEKMVTLSIWNFDTGEWEQLATESCPDDCTLTGVKSGSDYYDGDHNVWVWVKAENSHPEDMGLTLTSYNTVPITWTTTLPGTTQLAYDTVPHVNDGWDSYASHTLDTDLSTEHSVSPSLTDDSSKQWRDTTISSDGTKMAAVVQGGDVWQSHDGGVTWNDVSVSLGTKEWSSITSDDTGTKLIASINGGDVYKGYSTDGGATFTWTNLSTISTDYPGTRSWYDIASSADGTKVVLGTDCGYVYTARTTDGGSSWTWTEQTGANDGGCWVSVASDTTGTKLYAIDDDGSGVWYGYSDDNAESFSWTQLSEVSTNYPGNYSWKAIAMNANGTRIVVVRNGNNTIYTAVTADGGNSWTWTEQTSPGVSWWYGVAMNADGTKIIAGRNCGYLALGTYSSITGTWSWADTGESQCWSEGLSMSSSGMKVVAAKNGGALWVSQNGGVTFENRTGTIYYYKVRSCDENGICTTSAEQSLIYGLSSSCPFIFTWDGEKYRFIIDASSSGTMGQGLDKDLWEANPFFKAPSYPNPESYTKIPSGYLVPRTDDSGTYYDIRTTFELNEVNYYDQATLQVVDHSPNVNVFPDIKNNNVIHTIAVNAPAPVYVHDQRGNDVKNLIEADDNTYWHSSKSDTVSYLQMKLSDALTTPAHLKIVMKRGKEGKFQGNKQSDVWQYKNSSGVFVPVPTNYNPAIGIRSGQSTTNRILSNTYGVDTKVIDFSGLTIKDNEVRLVVTNRQIQTDIDWIAVDTNADESITTTELAPYYADLHFRGISKLVPTNPNDPRMADLLEPDYQQLDRVVGQGNPLTGNATRYGDVVPLLSTVDNKFVILVQGDELALKYAVPAQADGTVRNIISKNWDYHKSAHNALGDTILPLPFNEMSNYPYHENIEHYPTDADHNAYQAEYNTRVIDWGTQQSVPSGNGLHHSANTDYISVTVSDATPDEDAPVITLLGTPRIIQYVGSSYSDAGATASDVHDGDLTDSIQVVSDVDTDTPGTYYVTYNVDDAATNHAQEVVRTVEILALATTQSTVNTNQDTDIFIPADITSPTLDLTEFQSGLTAAIPNDITITRTLSSGIVHITIPGTITLTADGETWNGIINLPQTDSSPTVTASSGKTASVNQAVEIGLGSVGTTFDKGVRILFVGKASKLVGWTRNNTFTPVTSTCSADTQEAGDALSEGADCKKNVGDDLVVWTKHFTTYVVYTETNVSSGGGGGGGGGYISPIVTTNPAPTTNTTTNTNANTASQTTSNTSYKPQVCTPYLTSYIKFGAKNNVTEVKKLQTFLNTYEGASLVVDGVYKQVDVDAVKRFQAKHTDVLSFWNLSKPTGYVYVATQKAINRIYCEETKTLSCPYFSTYTQEGDKNEEVIKIKMFLNNTQGETLDTASTLFDKALTAAVKRFQTKYKSTILTPWGIKTPNGRWYQSTQKKASDLIGCFAPVRLDNGKVLE